jgi:hypothetical protein
LEELQFIFISWISENAEAQLEMAMRKANRYFTNNTSNNSFITLQVSSPFSHFKRKKHSFISS